MMPDSLDSFDELRRHAPPVEEQACALSTTQQDILLRQELLGSAIYTIGVAVRIEGEFDAQQLERAIQDVIAAEPLLKAHIRATADGPVWQQTPTVGWHMPYADLFSQTGSVQAAEQRALEEIEALKTSGIDPEGKLLWRMALFRTGPQRHIWLMAFNHVLVDKSCREHVIIRILIEEYLHIKIPMTRINRIADGGIYWL